MYIKSFGAIRPISFPQVQITFLICLISYDVSWMENKGIKYLMWGTNICKQNLFPIFNVIYSFLIKF